MKNLEINSLVRFEINGKIKGSTNKVIRVTDKYIDVQVNAPGSVLHCSILSFPKNTNEVIVIGGYGTSIYKIAV